MSEQVDVGYEMIGQPAFPDAQTESALLSTGVTVDVARASPADLAAVRDFYRQLDDTATYHRFMGLRRQLPDDELRGVVGATTDHVTLLATVAGRLIGIGEYIIGTDPTEAEVAFAVADDHHREGVATLLLERLAEIGHGRGLLRFTATVLPDNADMQLVFRTVGLPMQSRCHDGVVSVVLDLSSVVELLVATARRTSRRDPAAPTSGTPPFS